MIRAADAMADSAQGLLAEHAAHRSKPATFADRLLADVVNALERGGEEPIEDAQANAAARAVEGDFEYRIIVRARSLPMSRQLGDAIAQVKHALGWMIAGAGVLAFLAGAAAARAALGSPAHAGREPVNFFWVLGSLLGVQTLLLLFWLFLMAIGSGMLARPAARNPNLSSSPHQRAALMLAMASLGGLVMRAAQQLAARVHHGRHHAAAVTALSAVSSRGGLGKWTFSAVSNGLWMAFNAGCLTLIIILLGARQYTFSWETTILSEHVYVPLTRAIAFLPRQVGFPVPNEDQIRASQWHGTGSNASSLAYASQAWAGLLVGSMVIYGFAPRLLLLMLCLSRVRCWRRQYRLDVTSPAYLRLQPLLMPAAQSLGVVDADDGMTATMAASSLTKQPQYARPVGAPAIIGLEITAPQTGWPPRIVKSAVTDLGIVETGADQHRVLSLLRDSSTQPRVLTVVCSLTSTPDRGAGTFLRQLRERSGAPLALVLSGGQGLRQRGNAPMLEHRIEDWRAQAISAGLATDMILEIDLDHLTRHSEAHLERLVIGSPDPSRDYAQRHLEEAFAAVHRFAQERSESSSPSSSDDVAGLHRQIVALYRDHQVTWRNLLRMPDSSTVLAGSGLADQLRESAGRVADLLPQRLRASPKWLAAGAAAGALGCVAAASLISPIAIGGLPLWSAIGAAIAAIAQPASRGTTASASGAGATSAERLANAVRSAALLALLLELQGRDESQITRVLDGAMNESNEHAGDAELCDPTTLRQWLDDLRHRFDMALAHEVAQ